MLYCALKIRTADRYTAESQWRLGLAVRCGQRVWMWWAINALDPYKSSIARDYLWECYRIRYSLI